MASQRLMLSARGWSILQQAVLAAQQKEENSSGKAQAWGKQFLHAVLTPEQIAEHRAGLQKWCSRLNKKRKSEIRVNAADITILSAALEVMDPPTTPQRRLQWSHLRRGLRLLMQDGATWGSKLALLDMREDEIVPHTLGYLALACDPLPSNHEPVGLDSRLSSLAAGAFPSFVYSLHRVRWDEADGVQIPVGFVPREQANLLPLVLSEVGKVLGIHNLHLLS